MIQYKVYKSIWPPLSALGYDYNEVGRYFGTNMYDADE